MSNKHILMIISALIANFAIYISFHEFIQSDNFESIKEILENDCGKVFCEKVGFFLFCILD